MAIWNDKTKSTSTFVNKAVRGKWPWSSPLALWSDPRFTWSGVGTVDWTNRDKSQDLTSSTNNPFFGWLFLFTQPQNSTGEAVWINKTKH